MTIPRKRTFVNAFVFGALILLLFLSQKERASEYLATTVRLPRVGLLLASDPATAIKIGNYYFNGGAYDLTRAENSYRRALELDPIVPRAHYQLARIAFIRGNFDAAVRKINAEIEVYPEFPNAYYVRGLIGGYAGRYPDAVKDFGRFVELVPGQWAGYNDLAWIRAKQGDFLAAEAAVLQAFEYIPGETKRNPWLWTSLGVARLNLKEYDQAKEAFLRAKDIAGEMSAEYFWSAYPGNDPQGAEDAFRQFRATLTFNLGIVFEHLGELDEAENAYREYLALLPKGPFPKADEILGKIHHLQQKRHEIRN